MRVEVYSAMYSWCYEDCERSCPECRKAFLNFSGEFIGNSGDYILLRRPSGIVEKIKYNRCKFKE